MKLILIAGLGGVNDKAGRALEEIGKRSGMDYELKGYDFSSLDKLIGPFDAFIGHSLGAAKCLELIARSQSNQLNIKYFAAIDFVDGDWFPFWPWRANNHFTVPPNVQKTDCFRRKFQLPLPFVGFPSSRILNPSEKYVNYDVATSHGAAPSNEFIVNTILASLKEL